MEIVEKFKNEYEKYCKERGMALSEGNSKKANFLHKKITHLMQQAIDANLFDIFIPFLESEDDSVKLWTACEYLQAYPEISLKALSDLSKSSDFLISFKAKATIKLYKEGKWNKWIS